MNFRITKQRILFSEGEIVNETNRTKNSTITADEYRLNYDEIDITEHNLEIAKKINPNYEIGETHRSPLMSVSFLTNSIITETVHVFADPYYKLEVQNEDGSWKEENKHRCSL